MVIKTDIVHINSDLNGREEAVMTADQFNKWNKFTGKNAMHIRLLTEELICMVHDIMEGFIGNLWLESEYTEDGVRCKLCLSAQCAASLEQEKRLLAASSSGQNENARGILGKIREAMRLSMQYHNDVPNEYGSPDSWYGKGLVTKAVSSEKEVNQNLWSLGTYRSSLEESRNTPSEELDELKRSIIGKLADDVKVWITNDTTEVIIEKFIAVEKA